MDELQFKALLEKYINGACTPEEIILLESWYKDRSQQDRLPAPGLQELSEYKELIWQDIARDTGVDPPVPAAKTYRLWPRIAAAASIILALSAGGYLLLHKEQVPQVAQSKQDVAPYSQQAVLKTGHGRTIILDSTSKGLLAQYKNTHIQKTGNDQIGYSNSNEPATSTVVYDTLQIPAGGKPYRLKLADGSTIVVNVASAVRYPENFRIGHSTVELIEGEAYFSIIHNAKAPLIIKAGDQTIEDIGTEFNVNMYADEPASRTTLVDGSVKVNSRPLNPGQQAIVKGITLTITSANVEQTTAWKNGYFRFNGENIQTIMRELARWYNIEVRYDGPISKEGYYAKISRSKNISEVLKALERTNSVHFKIEGRRVTVSSKK